MDKICYLDDDGVQRERPCTPEEQAEIAARRMAEPPLEAINAPILAALAMIDAKSIRPLREGDTARVADLEAQAAALRLQLRKE